MVDECEKISKFANLVARQRLMRVVFGPKRARGFENKTPLFCMLKRYGKVYTQVVKTIIELITITFLIV